MWRPAAPTWRIGTQLFEAARLPPVVCGPYLAVEVGLFDFDGFPIHFQLFGDQHGQHGLDALPDFRVARDECELPSGAMRTNAVGSSGGGAGGCCAAATASR